ncbi:MAG: flavin reductase [Marinifilaceae bacterium]|jgi:flavin reductase (DIM6/NTAB) family NADH-FMN oxidoreductase RutF|nr:flavin reductase [Marinifilaceae bacterium]
MKKSFICLFIALIALSSCAQKQIKNMDQFEKISWKELDKSSIAMIHDWMLVGAGTTKDYNMMTASWGNMGWLWEKPISTIYVRPQRHTHNYTEKNDYYTLCFFDKKDKDILLKMGTVSGSNFDKMNYDKLTAIETDNGSIAFEEANLIIECKKIYKSLLKEDEFIDQSIPSKIYPTKDYHTVYIGEIINVWKKK